nr:putative acyl carrier protein [uncultured bacterium]
MSDDKRKENIKDFLSKFVRGHELGDDEDIFASGFVNSLLAMQLVAFVEKEFGVTVEDEDLDINNFNTVSAIASFVERKRG